MTFPAVPLEKHDRILILAPHPDDETVGTGGLIQHALEKNIPVHVVFLTNGDFNEWSFIIYRERPVISHENVLKMGEVRHDEAVKATSVLGLSENNLSFLGYPDYGTQEIWCKHWGDSPPYESFLTGAKEVPYSNSFRPGAPYKGEEILKDIKRIITDFKPTKIFVTHSADNHPDHRAFYLFTGAALMELDMDITLYPYLVHYNKWPDPRKYRPKEFLSPPASLLEKAKWELISLSSSQLALKVKALKEHKTQYEANTDYLLSFMKPDELFGEMPFIDIRDTMEKDLGENKETSIPEELIDEEKDFFTDLEKLSLKIDEKNLIFSATLSRPLAEAVELSVYLFGYRQNRDFSLMPKIHIKFTPLGYEIYDGYKKLSKDTLTVKKNLKDVIISLPLSSMGDPQKIFVSAETYLAEVPLDFSPWRIVVVKD
jgi:LmbE family N-acetylglucosaminyl deacetylase